jgi:hypothetical protein
VLVFAWSLIAVGVTETLPNADESTSPLASTISLAKFLALLLIVTLLG